MKYDEKECGMMKKCLPHIFSTLNSLSMQFVNASTDIPTEKVAPCRGFGRYRENDGTAIYRRLILAPSVDIFYSCNSARYRTCYEHMLGISHILPTDYPHTKENKLNPSIQNFTEPDKAIRSLKIYILVSNVSKFTNR